MFYFVEKSIAVVRGVVAHAFVGVTAVGIYILSWGIYPEIIFQGIPPFQSIASLGANTYLILAFDSFGFFSGKI